VLDARNPLQKKQSNTKIRACCAFFATARPFCFTSTPAHSPLETPLALFDLWVMLEDSTSGHTVTFVVQDAAPTSNCSVIRLRRQGCRCHGSLLWPCGCSAICCCCHQQQKRRGFADAAATATNGSSDAHKALPKPLEFWGLAVPSRHWILFVASASAPRKLH